MPSQNFEKILNFEGLISAPFTAFRDDGKVNVDTIPQYVDYLVKQGVTGVFVNGTTGEGLSLTVNERKAVAEAWVKHGKKKLEVVIIQIGANSLKDAQELAAHAEKIGATGIASLPPLFYKPKTDDQLVEYFKQLSEAAPTMPFMLYHIPSFSSVEVTLGNFLPKARKAIPNFVGAKFTSVDVRDLLKCHMLKEQFKVMSGFDEVLLLCLACGVTAAVGATYNFMAPLALKVREAFKKGDTEGARKYQNQIFEAGEVITSHGQGIACFKATMNLLSPLDFGPPRAPLFPLDPKELNKLDSDLKKLKAGEWHKI